MARRLKTSGRASSRQGLDRLPGVLAEILRPVVDRDADDRASGRPRCRGESEWNVITLPGRRDAEDDETAPSDRPCHQRVFVGRRRARVVPVDGGVCDRHPRGRRGSAVTLTPATTSMTFVPGAGCGARCHRGRNDGVPFPHELRFDATLEGSTITITTPYRHGRPPASRSATTPTCVGGRSLRMGGRGPVRERLELDDACSDRERAPVRVESGRSAEDLRRRLPGPADGASFVLEGGGRRIELTVGPGYPFAQVQRALTMTTWSPTNR